MLFKLRTLLSFVTSSQIFRFGWLTFLFVTFTKYLGLNNLQTLRIWSWIEKSWCVSKKSGILGSFWDSFCRWNYLQIITNFPLSPEFWRFFKSFGDLEMSLKPKRVDFNTTWADLKETVKGVITFSNVPRATWNDRFTGNNHPIPSGQWQNEKLFWQVILVTPEDQKNAKTMYSFQAWAKPGFLVQTYS